MTVDGGSSLAAVGAGALVQTSLGSFLVARTAAESFTVLTATCTHEACTVTGFSSGRFVCPCHGSQFTTGGAVVNGPASAPLRTFPATFSGGVLTFTV